MYLFSDLCRIGMNQVICFYDRPMVTTRLFSSMSGYSGDYLRPSRHVRWLDCIDRMRIGNATYWRLDDIVKATHARYGTSWTLVVEEHDYEVVEWVRANHEHGIELISAQALYDKSAPLALTGVVNVISDSVVPSGSLFDDETLPYPLGLLAAPDVEGSAPLPPVSFCCPPRA